MNLNATVVKLVDLAAVKTKDLKVRRIFILADGKRSLRDILKFANFDEQQGMEMAQVLIDAGYVELGSAPTTSTPVAGNQSRNGFIFTEEDIEFLKEEMGKYIGPFSSVLIQKKVRVGQSFSSEEINALFESLALKIEDIDQRRQFLTEIRADFS
jgi:hypothetical protein